MKTTIYEILKTKGIIKILSLILFLSSISNVFSQENESFIECSPPNIPNYSVEEFGLDYLIKNEGLPDNESGGMPIEILYNPAVNYYYAYCGMNLVIIDAGTMIKQRIKISDRGTYAIAGGTLFTDHIAERKIALNTNLNDLYIATEDETLVILDCGTNTVENTFNLPQPFENLIIDLYYNPVSNNIYWMMADNLGNSVVSVFDGEDNSLSGTNYFSNSKFYKITGSNDGNFIYIGMERFDTGTPLLLVLEGVSLNYIKDIPVDDVIVDLLYNQNTDRLYAVMEDNNSLAVFSGSNVNTFLYNIPMDNSAVKIALNPLNNRIYCTGNGELQIIDGDEEDDLFIKSIDLYGDYSYSMVFDPSENYLYCASGINKIYKVHGNYDIISSESVFNNNGTSHCLTINDQVSPHIIVSANTDIGNISFFNSQDMDYIDYVQTGGYISNGFYNGKANEVYLMQTNTNNLKSFINYYDGSTNEKIGEVTFNGTSGSLVSCDFDEDANRLFVASQQSHRLIVIDGVSHTEIANISVNHFPSLVYCIPGNDRLVCCTYDHIYVINKNSLVVEATIPKAQGRIDRVVMSEVNNNKIYGTISILNKVISVDFSDIGMPKVSYVEVGNYPTYIAYQGNTEPRLYCANLSNISIIDLGSFSVIGSINIGAPIVGFEYNEYMDQLYVLSNAMQTTVYTPGKLSVISCQNNTVIKVVPFDAYFGALKFNSVNNMVYFNALWNFGDIDDKMMLYSYNCETQTVASQVSLDLFQNHNECITWFSISNIILNTENNKLYVGNHGFSNASMIQCPTEKL
ncbi:MAG: hypothetical protein JXA03_09120, partial [Bacteroidales bacterium]|nr:hypothetical protein [Bacteroidales bacterium]